MTNKKQEGAESEITVSRAQVERRILLVRGQRVMLDAELAALYGVETKALLQAVRRNKERFPTDFAFTLSAQELRNLRSQIVTSSWGGRRYRPHAFTEQGVAVLSSVLRSPRAILVNIEIMRAFVWLRGMRASYAGLARKFAALEKRCDTQFKVVFDAIRELMTPPEPKRKRPIGFGQREEDGPGYVARKPAGVWRPANLAPPPRGDGASAVSRCRSGRDALV